MHQALNTHTYNESHCWQYHIRKQNLNDDLIKANLSKEEAKQLKVSDFKFEYVPKENQRGCQEIKEFIERHEWLGKMPTRPTHRFIASYKGILAGVVVMATPNAFSNLLGKENKDLEKLISRGACISWSPKNLGSSLVMFSVRWMAKNTEFRYFTAYSDTEARELGTIYQACNFIYLGQDSGSRYSYSDPTDSNLDSFSDRLFRKASFIKRKAIESGVAWKPEWQINDKINWAAIPLDETNQIKVIMQNYQASCSKRSIPPKHKYVYLLGRTKAETHKLKEQFTNLNPGKINIPYPKNRGPAEQKILARPCRISDQQLTKRPNPCWPLAKETKKYFSIKEISNMYGISIWLLYLHVKTDPKFPVVNIGVKKKFVIDPAEFEIWLNSKTKKFRLTEHNLPSSDELLEV